MDDFTIARMMMAACLGFHMLFAVMGIGMPLLMVVSEGIYLRRGAPEALTLAKQWAKGTAILFAVGAVSGTVLSFALGLLWPYFMQEAGPIIGLPFALEGFAFFTEAIFLGIYLYGWKLVPPLAHWFAGIMVAVAGAISGVFVVSANAWMNTPVGFVVTAEGFAEIDPLAAMFSPAMFHQVTHMALAAYVATGFAVAAVHAYFLLKDRHSRLHRRALAIALTVAGVSMILQLVSGDYSAKRVAELQPIKLASMEAHYRTEQGAPLIVGGIPNDDTMEVPFGLRIPYMLSVLAFGDPQATVVGLEAFPRAEWPNTLLVHASFDIMVGAGMLMALLAVVAFGLWLRTRRLPDHPWLLRALLLAGPLGFLAVETGWVVTEVGRQPWTIYGVMLTADAVTPVTGLLLPFLTFMVLYAVLGVIVIYLLRRQFLATAQPGVPGATPTRKEKLHAGA